MEVQMEKIYKKVLSLVKKAGKMYAGQPFMEAKDHYKYENDDVTSNDIQTQAFLIAELTKLIPNSGFYCEEQVNDKENKEFVWIIDPIDGTYNYKSGVPLYGTQLALQRNGKTIFSVCYLPLLKELYYSYGGKSYCNDSLIHASTKPTARSVILNFSLPGKERIPFTSETFNLFLKNKKLRVYGSCLYDFVLVASGKADCLLINSSSAWDIEPGLFIALNAGAKMLHLNRYHLMIVAGNNYALNDIEKSLKLIDLD